MVDIGTNVGRNTVAVISDMDEPLGKAVGNALEIKEAIDTLKGCGPKDLHDLCITLGSYMLMLSGLADTVDEAAAKLEEVITNGKAFEKLREFINVQGGNLSMIDNPDLLPRTDYQIEVRSKEKGYISKIVADEIGIAALVLGAGRETKESMLDLSVGIMLEKKTGAYVNEGDQIAVIHANDLEKAKIAEQKIYNAYYITKDSVPVRPLVFGVVTKEGVLKY
jgi:pyrimidine-nucleoside phosphorylase